MPDNNYWKKRMEHIEDMNHSKGIAYTQHIDKQFRIAQKNIEQKIDYWYARLADNNEISLSAARKLLAADELEDFHLTVEEYIKKGEALDYDPRWAKQLENASAKVHISRLEALKMQMQQECEVLFGGMADGLDDTLTDIYTSGYYHTAYEYMKGNGVGWAFNRLDNRRIKKALETCWTNDGSTFTARCWKNKQKLVNELNTILTQNIIRGESPQKAIQLLSKRMKVSRFNAGRLIMTESAFFNAQSQHDCYKDLDVEKFEFVATLDSSTSEICRDMDGKVFKMSEYEVGVNAPPLHCFCRSCTVPYFDDDTDSVRSARNAEGKIYNVPANMTYREWEKSFLDHDTKGLQEIADSSKMKSVRECSTVEEVETIFKNKRWFRSQTINGVEYDTNKSISLAGCDLESAKAVYNAFEQVFSKYPQLIGKLNSVNTASLSAMTYAQCSFGLGAGGIAVNTMHFNDFSKLVRSLEKDIQYGFHIPIPKPETIVVHELGHAVDDYLTYTLHLAGFNGWKPKIVSSALRPKVMKACGMKIGDIRTEVSGYATKDAQEWLAECFAEYICSDTPRTVAAELGKQLDELLKGVE